MLDEAIASYESVLATRIPDRKFDFSLDYEVINALGRRSTPGRGIEPVDSPERRGLPDEGDRRLPPHAGDRLRERRRPLRPGPGLRRPGLGRSRPSRCDRAGRGRSRPRSIADELRRARGRRSPIRRRRPPAASERPLELARDVAPVHGRPAARVRVAARAAARARRDARPGLGRARPTPTSRPRWRGRWRSTHKAPARACSSPTRPPRAGPFAIARKNDPAADRTPSRS